MKVHPLNVHSIQGQERRQALCDKGCHVSIEGVSSLPLATEFLRSSKQVLSCLRIRKKRGLNRQGLKRFPHSLQCVEQLSFTDAVLTSRLESWPGSIHTWMACHQDRCRSGWLSTYSSIIPSNSELMSFSLPSSTTLFFPQFMHL